MVPPGLELPHQAATTDLNVGDGAQRPNPSIPYELRIGVTGHRDLADPDAVRIAVRDLLHRVVTVFTDASRHPRGPHGSSGSVTHGVDAILTRLLSLLSRVFCPIVNLVARMFSLPTWPVVPVSSNRPAKDEQTPLKLTVVSSLSAGSDQLVTEVIRDLLQHPTDPGVVPAGRRNRYVEAVLPLPVEEYERTFSTAKDLATFQSLLQLDRGQFVPRPQPTVVCPNYSSREEHDDQGRHEAYAAAGRYVVDSSEIILAIWDPERAEKPGGTASTVRYGLDEGKRVIWLHPDRLQLGPQLLQIAEEGAGTGVALPPSPAGTVASPLPQRAKELSPNFHKLAAFGRDNAVTRSELCEAVAAESNRFMRQADGKLPEEVSRTITDHILPHVVRADQLSLRYQALRGVALRLWPNLAAFAVTLMGFQILFLPDLHWLAWIEIAVLLTCAIAHRVSLHEAWHDKWRNDRRLAEGLRGALFGSLVLADDEPVDAEAQYAACGRVKSRVQNPLPFYSATQTWFVSTLKRMVRQEQRRFERTIDWTRDLPGIAGFLGDEWIQRQADYHARNASKHHRLARSNTICRLAIISLILLVAVLHALGIGHEQNHHEQVAAFARIDLWIGWATVVLPAWAAALHALAASEDHERLSERSRRMAPLLAGLAQRMRAAESRSQLEGFVRQAEHLLDLENQEWAESLSERKPEFTG